MPQQGIRYLASVAVPPQNPLTLSGLQFFLDASVVASITQSSGFVDDWSDQSANAYSFATGGPPTKPTYSSTAFNSAFPGIVLDGTSRFVDNGGFKPLTLGFNAISFFCLVQLPQQGANNGIMTVRANGASPFGLNDLMMMSFDGGSGKNVTYYWDSSDHMNLEPFLNYNTPWFLGITWDGTTAQWYSQGSLFGFGAATTTSTPFGSASLDNPVSIGENESGHYLVNGSVIAFAGLTSTVMSATEFAGVKAYCNANWGTSF